MLLLLLYKLRVLCVCVGAKEWFLTLLLLTVYAVSLVLSCIDPVLLFVGRVFCCVVT